MKHISQRHFRKFQGWLTKEPTKLNNDSYEDPGCHWSSEPRAIVVEMPLQVRADQADDCIEIGSDSARAYQANFIRIVLVAT